MDASESMSWRKMLYGKHKLHCILCCKLGYILLCKLHWFDMEYILVQWRNMLYGHQRLHWGPVMASALLKPHIIGCEIFGV